MILSVIRVEIFKIPFKRIKDLKGIQVSVKNERVGNGRNQ
jgi:hypothetical protein